MECRPWGSRVWLPNQACGVQGTLPSVQSPWAGLLSQRKVEQGVCPTPRLAQGVCVRGLVGGGTWKSPWAQLLSAPRPWPKTRAMGAFCPLCYRAGKAYRTPLPRVEPRTGLALPWPHPRVLPTSLWESGTFVFGPLRAPLLQLHPEIRLRPPAPAPQVSSPVLHNIIIS